jgi:hypothetical protein
MLLLKLDITKAFDSVRWEYLLEDMEQLGFGPRWRDMISLIWSTTSSRIMLNDSRVGQLNMPRVFGKVIHFLLCSSKSPWTLWNGC